MNQVQLDNQKIFWISPLIVIAIGLLPMPYGYYNLLRLVVCGCSLFYAVQNYKDENTTLVWVFGFISILYNPVVPFHFYDKEIWTFINAITALIFIIKKPSNNPINSKGGNEGNGTTESETKKPGSDPLFRDNIHKYPPGIEAGKTTRAQISNAFIGTEYYEKDIFKLPSDIFDDLYIKGYSIGYITALSNFNPGFVSTEDQKLSYIISAFTALAGWDYPQYKKLQNPEAKIHSLDVNYKRGHLHATTQVKLSLGITDAIDDPLFEAALEMSKDSDLWDIGTAFNVVTINHYIEKKYDV